ncbi:hypothetical protein GB937_007430 [Aspergillus fischeri]|nr:hypothetical protein GB937_007430 [Aspergillus fischeri]
MKDDIIRLNSFRKARRRTRFLAYVESVNSPNLSISASPQLVSIDLEDVVQTARCAFSWRDLRWKQVIRSFASEIRSRSVHLQTQTDMVTVIRGEQGSAMPGKHVVPEELLSVFEISRCGLEEE